MAIQYLSAPLIPIPAAANSVTITSSSTAWNNSSWVELENSLANDSALMSITVCHATTADLQFEVDIGVGAAASEVVIATVKGRTNIVLADVGEDCNFNMPIPIEALSSGDRVAARIRTNASSTFDFRVAITVAETPLTTGLLTTANPLKVEPSAAAMATATSSGTPWANASWATLMASAPADLVIVGVAITVNTAQWEVDLGIGAASSEAVIATIRGVQDLTMNSQIMFPIPLDVVSSGDRVAIRVRENLATRTARVAMMYLEKPL